MYSQEIFYHLQILEDAFHHNIYKTIYVIFKQFKDELVTVKNTFILHNLH